MTNQRPIRWGILSTGNIAAKFAEGLSVVPDAELLAVGSRSAASAARFGEKWGIARRYDSYDALVADPDIDIIYVATPHSGHMEETLRCLRAGKAVICEKPFAINTQQAQAMVDEARARKIFLMEAMWTRYLPVIVRVRELIAAGAIGDVRMLTADFGFRVEHPDPQNRLFNLELGGGGLLDVGVYPVSLASMLFGTPTRITGMADLGPTGIDEQAVMVLGDEQGHMALLATSVRVSTPWEAQILGEGGRIHIPNPWWAADEFTIHRNGQQPERVYLPRTGNGYNYEAIEAMRCLRAGLTESEIMPLDETLAIMTTMDTLRKQWGLKYPME